MTRVWPISLATVLVTTTLAVLHYSDRHASGVVPQANPDAANVAPAANIDSAADLDSATGRELLDGPGAPALPSRPADPGRPQGRIVRMRVTAYCPCSICCGKRACGITASGRPVTADAGQFVAADTRLFRYGQRISVPGYASNLPVRVLDTGRAMRGLRLDVFFRDHATAREWGTRWLDVLVFG